MNYFAKTNLSLGNNSKSLDGFPRPLLERLPAEHLDTALKHPRVLNNAGALAHILKNPNLTKEHHAAIVEHHAKLGEIPMRIFHYHGKDGSTYIGDEDELHLVHSEETNRLILATALLNHRFTNRNDITRILKNTDSRHGEARGFAIRDFVSALDKNPNFKSSHIDEIMKSRPEDLHQHARNLGIAHALINHLPETRYNNSHIDAIIDNFSNPHPVAKDLNTDSGSVFRELTKNYAATDRAQMSQNNNTALQHRFAIEANESLSGIISKLQTSGKLANKHYGKILSSPSPTMRKAVMEFVENSDSTFTTPRSRLDFYHTHAPAIVKLNRDFERDSSYGDADNRYEKSGFLMRLMENIHASSNRTNSEAIDVNRHNLSALTGIIDDSLQHAKENLDEVKDRQFAHAGHVPSEMDATHSNSMHNIQKAYEIHEIHANKQEITPRQPWPWPGFDASKATQKVGDTHRPLGDALSKEQMLKLADISKDTMRLHDDDGGAILPMANFESVLRAIRKPINNYRRLRPNVEAQHDDNYPMVKSDSSDSSSDTSRMISTWVDHINSRLHDSSEPNFPVAADHDVVKKFLSIPDSYDEVKSKRIYDRPSYKNLIQEMSMDRNLSYENAKLIQDRFGYGHRNQYTPLMNHAHNNFYVPNPDANEMGGAKHKRVPYYHNFDIHPETGEITPKSSS